MREGRHIVIEGSYVEPIEVLPGYLYPWRFSWAIEGGGSRRERSCASTSNRR